MSTRRHMTFQNGGRLDTRKKRFFSLSLFTLGLMNYMEFLLSQCVLYNVSALIRHNALTKTGEVMKIARNMTISTCINVEDDAFCFHTLESGTTTGWHNCQNLTN
jgi:hypothetical protein